MSSEQPTTTAPPARIRMADEVRLTSRQREVADKIVAGKRGKIVGPFRVVLHSPELADRWQALGEFLRYDTSLPPRLSELAIIATGRYWNCQVEWLIHSRIAAETGLSDAVIESIRTATAPEFDDSVQAAVYDFTRELLAFGHVSDTTYRDLEDATDAVAGIELTAVVGYYSMVAMMLNTYRVPLPDDDTGPRLELPDSGELPEPTRLPGAIFHPGSG